MNATSSLPFHSLSLLLLSITAGFVYINFSITQNKTAQQAQQQTTSILSKNDSISMWAGLDRHITQDEYIFCSAERY